MELETADLDADEEPFLVRIIGIQQRVLQSGFCTTEQAQDDIETLIDLLRAAAEKA